MPTGLGGEISAPRERVQEKAEADFARVRMKSLIGKISCSPSGCRRDHVSHHFSGKSRTMSPHFSDGPFSHLNKMLELAGGVDKSFCCLLPCGAACL